MARETVSVVVVRKKGVRDGAGSHTTREVPVEGSPFECSLYRRAPQYVQVEGKSGRVVIDRQRVLSFRDPQAKIEPGDIAEIPPCIHNNHRAERVLLQNPRPYAHSLQVDLESGATPSATTSSAVTVTESSPQTQSSPQIQVPSVNQ